MRTHTQAWCQKCIVYAFGRTPGCPDIQYLAHPLAIHFGFGTLYHSALSFLIGCLFVSLVESYLGQPGTLFRRALSESCLGQFGTLSKSCLGQVAVGWMD